MNELDPIRHLEDLVRKVPVVTAVGQVHEVREGDMTVDAVLELHLRGGGSQRWLVEVKEAPLEPRAAQMAVLKLRELLAQRGGGYAVVVAPFVSVRSAEVLARGGIGFVDLSGNCRVTSGPLYLERSGFANAFARKAGLRSLFTPGAERVLRAVVDPELQGKAWTVRELAASAYPGVSLGQAHKVAKLLGDQLHMRREDQGLVVVEPAELLRAWAGAYRTERSRVRRYYTLLPLNELRTRLQLARRRAGEGASGVMASFSAAEVLAPAVRQHRFFAYWLGEEAPLEEALQLKRVDSGENVVVYTPYDEGVLYPASSVDEPVTCPVQTYLDLRASHARGEEAAEAVFDRCLKEAYGK